MATDDKKLNMKVLEFRGQDAVDLMKKLGLDVPASRPKDTRKWTKQGMVLAFGNFLDDSIASFIADMKDSGMNEKDIFESLQVAIAHNLGCVERSRAYATEFNTEKGEEGPADTLFRLSVKDATARNLEVGWKHKDAHLTNPSFKCKDPYQVGEKDEPDEDSPASA